MNIRPPHRRAVAVILSTALALGPAFPIGAAPRPLPKKEEIPWILRGLPPGAGRPIRAHRNPSPDAPWVIVLLDAHAVPSAQRSAAKLLTWLDAKSTRPLLVGVEGAAGPFDLDPYRLHPDTEALRDAADALTEWGFLNGAELFGLTATRRPDLWGIEDPVTYRENRLAARRAEEGEASCLKEIARLRATSPATNARLLQDLNDASKLAERRLSPSEWNDIRPRLDSLFKLPSRASPRNEASSAPHPDKLFEARLRAAVEFYHSAEKRDSILSDRFLARREETAAPVSAVLLGGFHAAVMEERLTRAGISWVSFLPELPDLNAPPADPVWVKRLLALNKPALLSHDHEPRRAGLHLMLNLLLPCLGRDPDGRKFFPGPAIRWKKSPSPHPGLTLRQGEISPRTTAQRNAWILMGGEQESLHKSVAANLGRRLIATARAGARRISLLSDEKIIRRTSISLRTAAAGRALSALAMIHIGRPPVNFKSQRGSLPLWDFFTAGLKAFRWAASRIFHVSTLLLHFRPSSDLPALWTAIRLGLGKGEAVALGKIILQVSAHLLGRPDETATLLRAHRRLTRAPAPTWWEENSPPYDATYSDVRTPGAEPPKTTDVLIIGDQLTGAGAAYHLALGNDRLPPSERRRVLILGDGRGASRRNAGVVATHLDVLTLKDTGFRLLIDEMDRMAGARSKDAAANMVFLVHGIMRRSTDLLRETLAREAGVAREHGIRVDYRQGGRLDVSERPVEWLRRQVAEAENRGVAGDWKALDAEEVRRRTGLSGAAYLNAESGVLNPAEYVRLLMTAALERGSTRQDDDGVLHFKARVTDLSRGNDGLWTARFVRNGKAGTVRARDVVLATDAGTSALFPKNPRLKANIIHHSQIHIFESDQDVDLNDVMITQGLVYVRQVGPRTILAGSDDTVVARPSDPASVSPLVLAATHQTLNAMFPGVTFTLKGQWGGYFGKPADGLPAVGPIDEGLWTAFGYGGDGIPFGPLAGQDLARRILKLPGAALFPDDLFSPARFDPSPTDPPPPGENDPPPLPAGDKSVADLARAFPLDMTLHGGDAARRRQAFLSRLNATERVHWENISETAAPAALARAPLSPEEANTVLLALWGPLTRPSGGKMSPWKKLSPKAVGIVFMAGASLFLAGEAFIVDENVTPANRLDHMFTRALTAFALFSLISARPLIRFMRAPVEETESLSKVKVFAAIAALGILAPTLADTLQYTGQEKVKGFATLVLINLQPIFVLIYARLINRDKITSRKALGVGIGLAGVLMAVLPGAGLSVAGSVGAHFLVMGAAALWAAWFFFGEKLTRRLSSSIVPWAGFGVMTALLAAAGGNFLWTPAALAFGVLAFGANALQMSAVARTGALIVAVMESMTPLYPLFIRSFMEGVDPKVFWWGLAGAVTIPLGVYLLSREKDGGDGPGPTPPHPPASGEASPPNPGDAPQGPWIGPALQERFLQHRRVAGNA